MVGCHENYAALYTCTTMNKKNSIEMCKKVFTWLIFIPNLWYMLYYYFAFCRVQFGPG